MLNFRDDTNKKKSEKRENELDVYLALKVAAVRWPDEC